MFLAAERWRDRLKPGWLLRALLARRGAVLAPLGPEWQRDLALIRATRRRVPLLMNDAAALQILLCVAAACRLDGAMAEAGVFSGGSASLICAAKQDRPLHLFDVFETLQTGPCPAPPGADEVRRHFGAVHGRRADVERLLAPFAHVHLHPGLFPASAAEVTDRRFAFVHLDLDLPQSTHEALAFFHPRMVPGGILIGDDYEDAAVRDVFGAFFAGRGDTVVALPWGQVMVVKRGD